ncbi:Aryl-alcohol dehydrogenase [Fusarium pseudocircinatum]|uniref:Aryl-alcohol dehydrogenase n=1 Tax=Fusarium pseudocircinatum TaxID=56676 RepID=A0A8H5KKN9_9HYPO|nr:Aryl-alcohol dehydrogenase [Fusarium pseudocircinatum]
MEVPAVVNSLLTNAGIAPCTEHFYGRYQALPDLKSAEDDWTGVTSAAQRKKLQNRLNQRAWHEAKDEADEKTETRAQDEPGLSLITRIDDLTLFHDFLKRAYSEYVLHAPRPSSLPLLIRINLLNALAFNASKLPMSSRGLCCADLISPFNLTGPLQLDEPQLSGENNPLCLRPTPLQKSVVHHPWIDLLPFAALRDNMLRYLAQGILDDDELCHDILGLHGDTLDDSPAMIVWGEPSDSSSWEVNPTFLRKWGWLVKGCPQIIKSTNAWRLRRREEPVFFES